MTSILNKPGFIRPSVAANSVFIDERVAMAKCYTRRPPKRPIFLSEDTGSVRDLVASNNKDNIASNQSIRVSIY